MNDEMDLLLGRLALNFRHVNNQQLFEAMQVRETSRRPLADILIERGWLTQKQLAVLQKIQGNQLGEIILPPSATRADLVCVICDRTQEVSGFDPRETYHCEVCGAVLDTEEPGEPIRAPGESASADPETVETLEVLDLGGDAPPVEASVPDLSPAYPAAAAPARPAPVPSAPPSSPPPEDPEALIRRARESLASGKLPAAVTDLSEAIRLAPSSAEAYLLRAQAHWRQERLQRTVDDCCEALKRDAEATDAWELRGHAHHARGFHAEAVADMDQALRRDPRRLVALLVRGFSRREMKNPGGGRDDLLAAIELAHSHPAAQDPRIQNYLEAARDVVHRSAPPRVRPDSAVIQAKAPATGGRSCCGTELQASWRFCPMCGKPAGRCPRCSRPLDPDWQLCPWCG